jgi:hypothetical protein
MDVSRLQVGTTIAHLCGIRRAGLIATWGRLVRTIDSRPHVGGLQRIDCVTCLAIDKTIPQMRKNVKAYGNEFVSKVPRNCKSGHW